MSQAILSPGARGDLRNIGTYTERTWGQNQRIKYTNQLYDRIDDLALNPDRGRNRQTFPEIHIPTTRAGMSYFTDKFLKASR